MNIFRKPSAADATGDAIPFYHDGVYHIFSLTPPVGTTVYPDRLRTSWSHTVSRDLIHWEELPEALQPGEGNEPDACGVWTGSVIFGEGKYHIFYTGYNYHLHFSQTICHATSDDGIVWTKDPENPRILPDESLFEHVDWRDPYVFYNEDEGLYWILLSGRIKNGPPTKRGSIILYRSKDLEHWEYYGPIYKPYITNCPECSEMWKEGETWYLSYSTFSEFVNTNYRVASSPYGPWRTPKKDGIGGRRFYAAKSLKNDDGRRFYFAWAHDRADRSDFGEWYWGGAFCIPHEVIAHDGEISVKIPEEYVRAWNHPIQFQIEPVWGNQETSEPDAVTVKSAETLSYGFFKIPRESFFFQCKMKPRDVRGCFGLLIKSDAECRQYIQLALDPAMQRVSLLNLPMEVDPFWVASCTNIGKPKDPGPDGVRVCERPLSFHNGDEINVQVAIDKDMIEIFVNDEAAFTYRFYARTDYNIGWIVQDGSVDFCNIQVTE